MIFAFCFLQFAVDGRHHASPKHWFFTFPNGDAFRWQNREYFCYGITASVQISVKNDFCWPFIYLVIIKLKYCWKRRKTPFNVEWMNAKWGPSEWTVFRLTLKYVFRLISYSAKINAKYHCPIFTQRTQESPVGNYIVIKCGRLDVFFSICCEFYGKSNLWGMLDSLAISYDLIMITGMILKTWLIRTKFKAYRSLLPFPGDGYCMYRELIFYSIDTHFEASTTNIKQISMLLKTLWGKGEIARNEQFLLFPQCFLPNQIIQSPFVHILIFICCWIGIPEPRIGIWGKGLN